MRGGSEGARFTRVCPGAVGRAWIAGGRRRAMIAPFPKLFLAAWHTLSLPLFWLSGMRGGNLKISENAWRLSRGIFLATASTLFSFLMGRGREARWAGWFSLSEEC